MDWPSIRKIAVAIRLPLNLATSPWSSVPHARLGPDFKEWQFLAMAHLTSYNKVFVAGGICKPVQARNSPHSRQETANQPWK
jgi:hypothetical protein